MKRVPDGESGLVNSGLHQPLLSKKESFSSISSTRRNSFKEGGFWRRMRERACGKTIPERVAQLYYAFGLFSSSHPTLIIVFSIIVTLFSCYPLINLPLGGKFQEFTSNAENYSPPPRNGWEDSNWPKWYKGPPEVYIQQFIIRSGVIPWKSNLILTDAFRGPLAQSFHVVDSLHKIKLNHSNNELTDLTSYCLHVGEVKSKALKGKISLLPEFNCLLLSPANFWQQSFGKFIDDPEIISTIMNFQSNQKRRSGLAEILLGMNVKDTGLKRNAFKNRPRIISYSITLVLKHYDERFISQLRSSLSSLYPERDDLMDPSNTSTIEDEQAESRIFHIYYPSQNSLVELIPLIVTYIAMFFYVYFSIRKVEMFTSKLGIAFSALYTTVACLCMSVGLCSLSGMTFEINGKAIFPYLVVIIGLENILVLTKSVVSTPTHLDVKIRVAQGLSKEGWSITKNLLTEVTILTSGFFTFLPMIQEFCILAIVGLVSDFFLQIFFFATVLSADIRRSELIVKKHHHFTPFRTPLHPLERAKLPRIKSNPRLTQNGLVESVPAVVAPSHSAPILVKIPKRLRLIYFWARTRFFQRMFMVFMIGWISIMIYQSGLLAHLHNSDPTHDIALPLDAAGSDNNSRIFKSISPNSRSIFKGANKSKVVPGKGAQDTEQERQEIDAKLAFLNKRMESELYGKKNPLLWRRLSPFHWQVALGIYNFSLANKYISILPPILLSIPVAPEVASSLRHPHELEQAHHFNWLALSKPFDPNDFIDEYDANIPSMTLGKIGIKGLISYPSLSDDPYVPTSPIELALTMLLAIPSIIFIAYTLFMFYKCICSRNYAEWRSSWAKGSDNANEGFTQVIFEAVPLVLDGHPQEVECISTDGNIISSVCLAGVIKVWSTTSGENISTIDRKRYTMHQLVNKEVGNIEDKTSLHSDQDSTGTSPPSVSSGFPTNPSEDRRYFYQNETGSKNSSFEHVLDGSQGQQPPNPISEFKQTHQRTSSQPIVTIPNSFGASSPISIPSPSTSINSQAPPQPSLRNPYLIRGGNTQSERGSNSLEGLNTSSNELNQSGFSPTERINKEDLLNDIGPVWSLDCSENLVVIGTGYGVIEIWDAFTGLLKCTYDDESGAGVLCLRLVGNRIIAARINGSLDFLEIEQSCNSGHMRDSSSPYHRWHTNDGVPLESTAANVSNRSSSLFSLETEIRIVWLTTLKAHQQPITCLDCEGGRILTGSQDHSLKVFRIEDTLPLFTLHGHYGPITCLFIDKISPMTSGSGSQDGMLCVWDLLTGLCMYSIQGHDGPINALTYSASYIISVGGDEKICVWERFQGHLLNTIQLDQAYCSSLVMLTHNLLITSKLGSLIVWDVRTGVPVRAVRLGHRNNIFVRQIMACADGILCDYGSQLRLVNFPSIINKFE